MEHGVYSNNPANLDIAGQGTYPDGGKITLHVANDFTYVMAENTNTPNNKYIVYQKHSEQFPNNIHCAALKGNTQAEWLCEKGFNGTPTVGSIEDGYKMYILQGGAEDGHYGTTYTNENNKQVSDGDKCIATTDAGCSSTVATDGGVCLAQSGESGCSYQSSFDNGSSCIAEAGAQYSCSGSDQNRPNMFTHNSACEGKGRLSCQYGNFTDSTCNASVKQSCQEGVFSNSTCKGEGAMSCSSHSKTASFTSESTCNGKGGASCQFATFTDSECNGIGYYSCTRIRGFNHSICNAGAYTCGAYLGGTGTTIAGAAPSDSERVTFNDRSICNGNGEYSCRGINFTNNSVCNANSTNSCLYTTYASGSYCAGGHCPTGTPAGDANGIYTGECWDGSGHHGSEYCS